MWVKVQILFSALTFAVVHKYENLPHVPRSHGCDAGIQITNNILVTDEVFLQERQHTIESINRDNTDNPTVQLPTREITESCCIVPT